MKAIKKDDPKWENGRNWFLKFFTNYFWVGLLLVVFSILIDAQYPSHSKSLDVLISIIETVGIAVLVASIFTFASGTSAFVEKIQGLLEDIVVNRNFLGNIDVESKRRALAALLKPSDIERGIYSNLDDYYNMYISKTLDITNKCVRSDYNVKARVFLDKETDTLVVSQDISYRIHPTKEGYDAITIGFYDDKNGGAKCEYVAVSTSDGKRKVIDKFKWNPINNETEKAKVTKIELNDFGREHSHLNIDMRLIEHGFDHWISLGWQALQPTDGFSYSVCCEDGIVIKSYNAFVHGAKLHVENRSDSEMLITCHQWFNEGTGIVMVAALDLEKNDQAENLSKPVG